MSEVVDKFKPLNDYVVVLIPVIEDKTPLGFLKTEKMKEEEFKNLRQVFEIVAVGPNVSKSYSECANGVTTDYVDLTSPKVGQYALCTRINEVPIESNKPGFKVAVVRVFDIIGVFDEE